MRMTLKILDGPEAGTVRTFSSGERVLIGRAPDAVIRLQNDPYISRHHAVIEVETSFVRMRDLNSQNGFQVNGTPCGGDNDKGLHPGSEIVLHNRDRVEVGSSAFTVRIEGDSAVSAPASDWESRTEKLERIRDDDNGAAVPDVSIAGFRLEKLLAEGGTGSVYRAVVLDTDETVAVKILRPEFCRDPDLVGRFYREMDVATELDHPNIVRLHRRGREADRVFLVMEYVNGPTLEELTFKTHTGLTLKQAAPMIRQMLDGMAYAHDHGIVHRDLKPANFLLTADGDGWRVKIADLGLAKSFIQSGITDLTTTGFVAGTCMFMPPEQVTSFKHLKPSSDVFSLGATIYYMLTRETVYDVTADSNLFMLVLSGKVVPLRDRATKLPDDLVALIDRAIAREPGDRWENASAMREDFIPFLETVS